VGEAIRTELPELIRRQVKDPRVEDPGILTVTRVEVSKDISVAHVWVSFVGGSKKAIPAAIEALNGARHLRGEIGRRLSLRHAPDLRFKSDDTAEFLARLDAAVKKNDGD
jgi:ribosome-binding factor A